MKYLKTYEALYDNNYDDIRRDILDICADLEDEGFKIVVDFTYESQGRNRVKEIQVDIAPIAKHMID
jgi:hypothetical protein